MGAERVDDDILWHLSRTGDAGSFDVLFERHQDRVFRHACRLVDNLHDAEDVTAATFLELWRRRDDVRLVGDSLLPWLPRSLCHPCCSAPGARPWSRSALSHP